jgi:hypothetical protein
MEPSSRFQATTPRQAPSSIHDQVDGEVLDEELGVVLQALLIEGVQDGVAGAVGGGAGPLHRGLAVVPHVAAERPLIDLAVLACARTARRSVRALHRRDACAAHVLDGVLVAEPVGALDRVVHVPLPVVLGHVAEGGADAALGGDGVAAGREHLGDAGGLQACGGEAHGRAEAGAAGADDDHVIGVVGDRIGIRHRQLLR